ncbi:uncharacterized protein LOC121715313 [Alosa sapidissima]|uniref:uncharacterized protein LOC121715313 n=1 Tax=Alosa sapidissima TaxID=34773 RepID=UPI001C08674C|nr:uncharacterized protein LOC121715313 [Alosa sapidissima]
MAGSALTLSLMLFISGANFQQNPTYLFSTEGKECVFIIKDMDQADYYVLYWTSAEGDLLLLNSSQTDFPQPGYYISFFSHLTLEPYFVLGNVAVSQSGDYRVDGWKDGSLVDQTFFCLAVCTRRSNISGFGSASQGGSLDLSYPNQVYWKSPRGNITLLPKDSSQIMYDGAPQQKRLHMLNGSKTGDYSLVIPSVSTHHSGEYTCMHQQYASLVYHIYSCIRFTAIDIRVSHGETALLECAPRPKDAENPQTTTKWYRKRPTETEALILESVGYWTPVLHSLDLAGRVSMSDLTWLALNVTAEDSGVYRCRVWAKHPRNFCHERIINLQYVDTLSVSIDTLSLSIYTALMSCILLAMVVIVITVSLKRRGRHQADEHHHDVPDRHQQREGQQNGGPALYEDVKMAAVSS